ncbi:hypothetical protein [Brumimicrobium aurantiacum]|uniref:Uncharacterized protein n=1 Tax=Brumimicrobium aurantiacum TaxID=1737063 RepID=A0A3E1EZT2_9FLAO|nr:hypothetical protein [Brumimicrobium aurantiacum]RFC55082.1 hypothetical protein DXU93_04480 [Brumimicrobium aurantiacum]
MKNKIYLAILIIIFSQKILGQIDIDDSFKENYFDTLIQQESYSKKLLIDTSFWKEQYVQKPGFWSYKSDPLGLHMDIFFIQKKDEIDGEKVKKSSSSIEYFESIIGTSFKKLFISTDYEVSKLFEEDREMTYNFNDNSLILHHIMKNGMATKNLYLFH